MLQDEDIKFQMLSKIDQNAEVQLQEGDTSSAMLKP